MAIDRCLGRSHGEERKVAHLQAFGQSPGPHTLKVKAAGSPAVSYFAGTEKLSTLPPSFLCYNTFRIPKRRYKATKPHSARQEVLRPSDQDAQEQGKGGSGLRTVGVAEGVERCTDHWAHVGW